MTPKLTKGTYDNRFNSSPFIEDQPEAKVHHETVTTSLTIIPILSSPPSPPSPTKPKPAVINQPAKTPSPMDDY